MIAVAHTYGGTVALVEVDGERYDLSPDQAEKAAADCEIAATRPSDMASVLFQTVDRKPYRYVGTAEDCIGMAKLLREAASAARAVGDDYTFRAADPVQNARAEIAAETPNYCINCGWPAAMHQQTRCPPAPRGKA